MSGSASNMSCDCLCSKETVSSVFVTPESTIVSRDDVSRGVSGCLAMSGDAESLLFEA